MTSMNRDTDDSNLAQAIRFAIRQSLKDIYTCMPGVIESYDPDTLRAMVKGALRVVTATGEEIEREVVHNVPVVFPSGGGFALTFPLEAGDPVLLVYSQRGLSEFKKTLGIATPGRNGFFSEQDAVALPGFGPLEEEPDHVIAVDTEGISIKSAGRVFIEATSVEIVSASLTHNGIGVGDSHTHSGVRSGGSNTGGPA